MLCCEDAVFVLVLLVLLLRTLGSLGTEKGSAGLQQTPNSFRREPGQSADTYGPS